MTDTKNFAIGILATTATILVAALVIVHSRPEPAYAAGMTTTNADYVLTVGSLSTGNEEVVYVIDAPMQRLIAYRFNSARGEIQVADAIDLGEMRKAASAAQQPPPTSRRGRKP